MSQLSSRPLPSTAPTGEYMDSVRRDQREPDVLDDLLISDPSVLRLLDDIRAAFACPGDGDEMVLNFMDTVNFIDLVRPQCCKHIHLYKLIKELLEARGVLMSFNTDSTLSAHAHKIFKRVYPDHAVRLCSLFDRHRAAHRSKERMRQNGISHSLETRSHKKAAASATVLNISSPQLSYSDLWTSSGLQEEVVESKRSVHETSEAVADKDPSALTWDEMRARQAIRKPEAQSSGSSVRSMDTTVQPTDEALPGHHQEECIRTLSASAKRKLRKDKDIARAVSNIFSGGKLYGGSFFEDWKQHLQIFLKSVEQYQLCDIKKAYHFQMSLKDEALRQYLPLLAAHKPWSQCIQTMQIRFDSPQKQMKASEYLRSLRLEDFRAEGKSEANAFSDLLCLFGKITPMALPADQLARSKSELLQNACSDAPWLSQAQDRYGSSSDCMVIHDCVVLTLSEIHHQQAAMHGKSVGECSHLEVRRNAHGNLYYFINHIQPVKGCQMESSTDPLRNITVKEAPPTNCFNCGTPGCTIRKCPHPKDRARISRSYNAFFGGPH